MLLEEFSCQSFRFFNVRFFLFLAQFSPRFSQHLADQRVVDTWILLQDFTPFLTAPHHETVHGSFDMVLTLRHHLNSLDNPDLFRETQTRATKNSYQETELNFS